MLEAWKRCLEVDENNICKGQLDLIHLEFQS